jgi:DNA polymerase
VNDDTDTDFVTDAQPIRDDLLASAALIIDFETRSPVSLKQTGAWRYAADPATDAILACWAREASPVNSWMRGDPPPIAIVEACADPDTLFVAHNAMFERAVWTHILAPRHGWPPCPPPKRWRDTLAMARAQALPGKLGKLAGALGLKHQKAGDRIMHLMSKPRRARKGEDHSIFHWHDDPKRLEQLRAYCQADVECERELYQWLPPLVPGEQELWELDQVINERGFYTDGVLIEKAIAFAEDADRAVQEEFRQIIGGA